MCTSSHGSRIQGSPQSACPSCGCAPVFWPQWPVRRRRSKSALWPGPAARTSSSCACAPRSANRRLANVPLRRPNVCGAKIPLPAASHKRNINFCFSNRPDFKGKWAGEGLRTCEDWRRPGMHGIRKEGHACASSWTHEHRSVRA